MKSMALPRSLSCTIFSKMRRWASRKKSRGFRTSAAELNASLWIRIAPRTERSASRLCGRARSMATSGMSRLQASDFRRQAAYDITREKPEAWSQKPAACLLCLGRRLRLAFRHHLHRQLNDHFAVQLHRHRVLAELLDGLAQTDFSPVGLEALLREHLRDVGGGDRAVERSGLADFPRDDGFDAGHARRNGFGTALLFRLSDVELHSLALDLLQVAWRRQQRELAQQQEIARVAVRDLHHFAALSDVLDMISKNDFHWVPF